jgi:circadian clock protein KaiB
LAKKLARREKHKNDEKKPWELLLYVAGDNINGKNALAVIKKICLAHLFNNCHIRVIDLRKTPEMALKEHIVALPMLVRTYPEPRKILVGDLTDTEKVLRSLEIERSNIH